MTAQPSLAPVATAGQAPLVLPTRPARGTATARALRRTRRSYAALAAAGLLPVVLRRGERAQTLGLGLLVPGGGYFATGRSGRGLATMAGTALSAVNMLVTGNVVAPPAVWLGAAVRSARGRGDVALRPGRRWAVPAATAGAALAIAAANRRAQSTAEAERSRRNLYLAVQPRPTVSTGAQRPVCEPLNELEAGLVRTLLDLAMQPLDAWDGYTKIDQFREAAYRYQLTFGQMALAVAQSTRTPAFTGVYNEAQSRFLRKHEQPIVWRYWFYENLWGNLSTNPDPIRHKNIMLSGWLAASLGLYEGVTGDLSFDEPGALKFRRKGRGTDYGYDEICRALVGDLQGTHWALSDCEPGWTFQFCNVMSGLGLLMHDRTHGTDHWERVRERFVRGIQEDFTTCDGRVIGVRSSRLGAGIMPSTVLSDTQGAVMLRPLDRDTAERAWMIAREEYVGVDGGALHLAASAMEYTDPGNYQRNSAMLYSSVIGAAREFGDDEVATLATQAFLAENPPVWTDGAVRFDGVSMMNHAYVLRALLGRRDGWYHLVTRGLPDHYRIGPRVTDVPYPDALVTSADSDGRSLDVSLRSRTTGPIRIGLAGLDAGRSYRSTGAVSSTFAADPTGTAELLVDVRATNVDHTMRVVPGDGPDGTVLSLPR